MFQNKLKNSTHINCCENFLDDPSRCNNNSSYLRYAWLQNCILSKLILCVMIDLCVFRKRLCCRLDFMEEGFLGENIS